MVLNSNVKSNDLAVVVCVHHKPWLVMGTLITLAAQDIKCDIHLCFMLGDGTSVQIPEYEQYYNLSKTWGDNPQLSEFEEEVYSVCDLNNLPIHRHYFVNDHALDSGAWLKWRELGLWKQYKHVMFAGEGLLFARENTLKDMLKFSEDNNVHFIGSGHEKRRLAKSLILNYFGGNKSDANPSDFDKYHNKMIKKTFEIFKRDKSFSEIYSRWGEGRTITENHVPDIWSKYSLLNKSRNFIESNRLLTINRILRRIIYSYDRFTSYLAVYRGKQLVKPIQRIHINGKLVDRIDVNSNFKASGETTFHSEESPEWFNCAVPYLVSNKFLEHLDVKFNEYKLKDSLLLPFSATALESIWGFMPSWLGFEKWFCDGIHRPRKNFVTFYREDDCEGVCSYINRYYKGKICVKSNGRLISVIYSNEAMGPRLSKHLPPLYFKKFKSEND